MVNAGQYYTVRRKVFVDELRRFYLALWEKLILAYRLTAKRKYAGERHGCYDYTGKQSPTFNIREPCVYLNEQRSHEAAAEGEPYKQQLVVVVGVGLELYYLGQYP